MGPLVFCMIDDVEVTGKITHRSSQDISVEINSPYINITAGAHLSHVAAGVRSFLVDYGDARAKELLQEIFELCHAVDRNYSNLTRGLERFDQSSDISGQVAELKMQLSAIRGDRRNGHVAPRAYSQNVQSIKAKLRKLEQSMASELERYLSESLSMMLSDEQVRTVIGMIRGEIIFRRPYGR